MALLLSRRTCAFSRLPHSLLGLARCRGFSLAVVSMDVLLIQPLTQHEVTRLAPQLLMDSSTASSPSGSSHSSSNSSPVSSSSLEFLSEHSLTNPQARARLTHRISQNQQGSNPIEGKVFLVRSSVLQRLGSQENRLSGIESEQLEQLAANAESQASGAVVAASAASPTHLIDPSLYAHLPSSAVFEPFNRSHFERLRKTSIPVKHQYPALSDAAAAFLAAVQSGDLAQAQTLAPAKEFFDVRQPTSGASALHIAALNGDVEMVQWLLSSGADVNARTQNHATPLHWAAGSGHIAVARLLLSSGADPCATTMTWHSNCFGKASGQTPLHWAAESGHSEMVRLLVSHNELATGVRDEQNRVAADVVDLSRCNEAATTLSYLTNLRLDPFVPVRLSTAPTVQRVVTAAPAPTNS